MREQIDGLATDVRRLLLAGGQMAAEDASLRRRVQVLRDLAGQVPALTPLADAVERVIRADARQATAAFLQLLLVVRVVQGSLAQPGGSAAEPLEPLEKSGPWSSTLDARDLLPLYEARRKPEENAAQRQAKRTALRDALARTLGRPGQADLRLLPPLLDRLDDEEEKLTDEALPAYGPALVGELRRSLDLQGDRRDVRKLAILCRLDPKGGKELCRQALAEGNWMLQVQGLRSLAALDAAEGERTALRVLDGKATSQLRGAALAALGVSKSDAALDRLLKGLSESGKVYEGAIDGLRGSVHPRAGQRMLDALKAAVAELEALSPPPVKSGKKKTAKPPPLSKPDQARREKAELTARRLGELLAERADLKGLETLLELLHHPLDDVAEVAMDSLREVGPNARPAVPLLIQALDADDEDARASLADALGSIGPVAPESLPALVKLLEDKRWWVQSCALDAIQQFGELAVGPLSEALLNENPNVRATAASALGDLREHATPVVRDLVRLLNDRSGEVRRQAAYSLGQIGNANGAETAPVVVPALLRLTKDRDRDVQRATFLALRQFGPHARPAVPELIKLLQDKSPEVRQMVLWSLGGIGPEARDAIPSITKLLKDRSANVRSAAETALEEIQSA